MITKSVHRVLARLARRFLGTEPKRGQPPGPLTDHHHTRGLTTIHQLTQETAQEIAQLAQEYGQLLVEQERN